MKNSERIKWLLPVFSGIFLILSIPPFNLSFCLFFSLLPLFFFLSSKDVSLKKSFLAGFITGFVFFAQVASWLFEVFPASVGDIKSDIINNSIICLVWISSSIFLAAFFGLFSLSYFYLKRKNAWDILLIPSLWAIFDYLRVWAFGIFLAGKESLFGAHWTFGSLAYSLSQNQGFRSLAGIGGIYLIGFLVVLFNFLLFFLLRKLSAKRVAVRRWYFAAILAVISLIVVSYFVSLPSIGDKDCHTLNAAIVQTKIPSYFSPPEEIIEEKIQVQRELLKNISLYPYGVDIVVLPEDSSLQRLGSQEINLGDIFSGEDVLIIDSTQEQDGKFTGTFLSTKEGILGKSEKMFLVPYSNYFPYSFELLARTVNRSWLEEIKKFKNSKKGTELVVFDIPGKGKVSILFCSESISPDLHRELAEKGTQVFLNAGSLAFSRGSRFLDSQTLAMLQLRAAENGRYLVRATNFGRSYIIDDRGKVIKISPNLDDQVLFGKIRLITEKTFYTKYGDWILILSGLLSLIFLVFKRGHPAIDKAK